MKSGVLLLKHSIMDQMKHKYLLNQRAFSIRQSGRSLPTYYGELVKIFQELDYRDKVKMRDLEDIIMYKTSVDKLRIHIFLNGLDAEFEQV